jgi:glycosyltransferase involved in cell wall biosynthesis
MTDERDGSTISFIIPVLNGELYVARCIDHILEEMNSNDEIVVVDNGSTDDTVRIVEQYPKVRLLIIPEVTIATLRNRGADIAKGDVLAFIDSDCLVCDGWRKAVEAVLSDNRIAVTGSICDVPSSGTWIEKAWWSLRRYKRRVNYIASANLVMRHETFNEVAGFDEELITDEDTEICSRIRELGYCIMEDPGVRVIHLGNAKTFRDFVKKEKWHATSILSTMSGQRVDKPMIMTFVFLACMLLAIVLVPFVVFGDLSPVWFIPAILLVPLVTASYSVCQNRNFRYLPHLIVLYAVFYLVRSITIAEALFKGRPTRTLNIKS